MWFFFLSANRMRFTEHPHWAPLHALLHPLVSQGLEAILSAFIGGERAEAACPTRASPEPSSTGTSSPNNPLFWRTGEGDSKLREWTIAALPLYASQSNLTAGTTRSIKSYPQSFGCDHRSLKSPWERRIRVACGLKTPAQTPQHGHHGRRSRDHSTVVVPHFPRSVQRRAHTAELDIFQCELVVAHVFVLTRRQKPDFYTACTRIGGIKDSARQIVLQMQFKIHWQVL